MKSKRMLLVIAGVLLLTVIIIVGVILFTDDEMPEIVDPAIQALKQLETDSLKKPDFYFQNGFPRFADINLPMEGSNSVERAQNFLNQYNQLYLQDDPRLALHVRRVSGENDDFVLFYQTYLGFEVYSSEILVMVNGENVTATVGGLLPAGVIIDTTPMVGAEQAAAIAKQAFEMPDAMVVGEVTPMVYDPSIFQEIPPDPHFVWRVPLGPGATQLVYVDAHDGEVLLENSLAIDGYSLDHEDANGYPDGNVDCYWATTDDDYIGSENGLISEYLNDNEAVTSWWHSHDAYYFFLNEYGRDAYDNDGGELELYIYSGAPNARWVGGFGCDLIEFREGWVSWDVMIHEYAHGVQFYTSQIGMHGGYGQAMSLRESFADIQAAFADPYDWFMGEDRTGYSGFVRFLSNPPIGHMDDYNTSGTKSAGYDNSGIPSKAAVYTSGGSWINGGLGREKMGHLYYSVMNLLPHNAQFIDARNLAVSIASQYYSVLEGCYVRNAWAMVGIGVADVLCDGIPDPDLSDDDMDYVLDVWDNCPGVYNPFQKDMDGDGIGDECDNDDDGDGIWDVNDNCPTLPNSNQADQDNDGKGDICDDEDGDFVLDIDDNCPFVANPFQIDTDGDGLGDGCDPDLDGDGIPQVGRVGQDPDNCPFEPNTDQLDSDGDGIGDACDACPFDYDFMQAYTVVDPMLASMGVLPEPYQPDSDGDGIPDACDPDVRVDGEPLRSQGPDWEPDGRPHEVEVSGDPGSFLILPIPACQPEEGWYPQNYRGQVVLEGLEDHVGAWVGDSAGFGAGKSKAVNSHQIIQFQPRGGMNYFLLIGFSPDYPEDQKTIFTFNFECFEVEKEEQEGEELIGPVAEYPVPPEIPLPDDAGSGEPDVSNLPNQGMSDAHNTLLNRCDHFGGAYTLTLYDIEPGSDRLNLHIRLPDGVPGLEVEVPDDPGPWEYSGLLGSVEANACSFQGYQGRLYCDFTLPETYMDTVRPLSIYVNGCDIPIFYHPRVSILAPEEPLVCSTELAETDCIAAGGTYECGLSCSCRCPE